MPTSPVESPYCVHCGYDKAALTDGATVCPECGHSVDDAYIPAMETPPLWWRVHRLAWVLFEGASYAMLATAACLVGGIVALVLYDQITGSGAGTGAAVVLFRNFGFGFVALSFVLTFSGGVCAFARVPWMVEREQTRSALLATNSVAMSILGAIPLWLAMTGMFMREVFGIAILLSAAIVLVDVRMLKQRAASYIRFTTNDTQSAFFDDSHRSVDIAALMAIAGALYMLFGGARPNLSFLVYVLMLFGWMGLRGRAASAVRKELRRAREACARDPKSDM